MLYFFVPAPYNYALFAFATMYHVVKQQVGIAWSFEGKPAAAQIDTIVMVTSGVFVLFLIAGIVNYEQFSWVRYALTGLMLLLAAVRIWVARASASQFFSVSNYAMVIVALRVVDHWIWISILLPRLVHDWCAYTIYIRHDTNQQKLNDAKNWIYRWLPAYAIGIFIVIASIGINAIIMEISLALYLAISVFHYFTERVIWRKGSLHRRTLTVTPPKRKEFFNCLIALYLQYP